MQADVFAPCALGGAISARTLPQIKAQIIAGAANNQLASSEMGEACRQRGILYAPDYVVNAGGIINVAAEVSGRYDPAWVSAKLDELEVTIQNIFNLAAKEGLATNIVADKLARERLGMKTN